MLQTKHVNSTKCYFLKRQWLPVSVQRLGMPRLLRGTGTVKDHQVILVQGVERTWMLQALWDPETLEAESAHPHPDTALRCLHLRCLPGQNRCSWNENTANYLSGQFNRSRRSPCVRDLFQVACRCEKSHMNNETLCSSMLQVLFTCVNSHSFLHSSLEPGWVKSEHD